MRTIVTKEMLREANREVRELGPHRANVKLSKVEPVLVAHVLRGLDRISKKLVHLGLPYEQGVYPDMLQVMISSLEAQRKAQFALVSALRQRRGHVTSNDVGPEKQVSTEILDEVEAAFWPIGRDRAMRELHAVEPELQRFIVRVHASVQEQVAHYEIPDPVRELLSEQLMIMAAICVSATRKRYLTKSS
jgi:hypothetical protein